MSLSLINTISKDFLIKNISLAIKLADKSKLTIYKIVKHKRLNNKNHIPKI